MNLPSRNTKLWIVAAMVLLGLLGFAHIYWAGQGRLIALSELTQVGLGALMVAGVVANLVRARQSNARLFWMFMSIGFGFWLCGLVVLAAHEIRHPNTPAPDLGNILIYFHAVAMMAAFAAQPHREWEHPDNQARLLDFALLVLWWVYLYLFAVAPWRYVSPETHDYRFGLNALRGFGLLILEAGIAVLWLRSKGTWRKIYLHYLIAGALYTAIIGSIQAARVTNGSVLDHHIWMVMALFYYAWIGWHALPVAGDTTPEPQPYRLWRALTTMAAILSIPFIALWSYLKSGAPAEIQSYRIVLSFLFLVLLTALLFLKQYLLDLRLIRLLNASRNSLNDLQRVQDQLLQTEKLASLGRLVGGAAHEINNPLTAILGYADMLATEPQMQEEHRMLASKILQQARRTKSLISSMLVFAKQKPGERNALDINTIVASAIQLRELDLDQTRFKIQRELAPALPRIVGDEAQLLQVFAHILNNAVDALHEVNGGTILISTSLHGEAVQIEIADTGPGVKDPAHIFDPFYTTKPVGQGVGLGLSACYGIIQEHGGEITCANHVAGGAVFRISLPTKQPAKTLTAGASTQKL